MKTLDELMHELRLAKCVEADAKAHRVFVEEQIVDRVENAPASGSRTLKGSMGRATVKFGVRYSADVDAIRCADIDPDLIPVKRVPESWAFDAKAYEALRESNPSAWRQIAKHVTTKPSKPGVTLKG